MFGSSQSLGDGTTLVSKEGMFEFGFFSPGNSKNRYVGIWYKNIPVQTVIWVANRCNPLNDSSGLLTINETGNLVVLDRNNSVVWSTSSSKQAKKPIAQLLNSGNLVLRDEEDVNIETNYLWQSFDYPSDSLLPGMKFGWDLRKGLNRRLSAWRNWDDPCPGDLTHAYEVAPHTYPDAYIMKGTKKYHRGGPFNGVGFSGVPDIKANTLFDFEFVFNDEEVYYKYQMKNNSTISRVVMNQTLSTRQRAIWVEADRGWKLYSWVPKDYCDTYGLCGGNGVCIISENPVCQCLKGFEPKSPEKWNQMDWSGGCVRANPLSCQDKEKDGFVKLVSMKMPDTAYSWVNKSMNLQECKGNCLSNCSCMAYTNADIRGQGSGCVIWFGDLMDIRKVVSGEQDLYVRMSASELHGKAKGKVRIVIVVLAIIGGVFGMLLVGYFIYKRRLALKAARERDQYEDLELPLFDLATIANATGNFAAKNKLGQGGFGPVYKGTLVDGQEIAVKRLSSSSGQGLNEFKNEVILIAKLQHRNLVKLLGCCIQGEEKLLIYEYMPNKSLDFIIFDETRKRSLPWSMRYQIICGIARGILYLHQDSRLRIIHRDLKTSNVLLDKDMNPKISDFGMAKTFRGNQIEGNTNRVVGTYGYMAPEYASDGLFSVKSDVFSFGILVLEIISGKKNRGFFQSDHSLNLAGQAWRLWKEGNHIKLSDDFLVESCPYLSEVQRCIHISLLCVQQCPDDRPSMSSVVLMLGSQSSLDPPKQPGFFFENDSVDHVNASSYNQETSSNSPISITMLEAR
ncbi:hypothetical protein TIFTF001_031048 [Ficus carica]|uniref:Receptor-like serine/threonine-protein kinase n=1 Tax=Ficus carica TaxID=3494 RepID=A0AA88DUT5_FICCA|nr:hypothetical protein TIFTF001_031048 [Ficus carica]